jgi:hypothetical protein
MGGEGGPVKGLKPTLISILAIGLLAGSAVGVTAQDEAADPMAPAFFTFDRGEEVTEEGDLWVRTWSIEASDERASGMMTSVESIGEPVPGTTVGELFLGSQALRLVNDDGVWSGKGEKVVAFTETPETFDQFSVHMVGEDGYEGLTMMMFSTFLHDSGGVNIADSHWGVIVPTDSVPPFPELPAE